MIDLSLFRIEPPALISFSFGRTSGFLLRQIQLANGGLPQDIHVCFANTGKEVEGTLVFGKRCSDEWGIKINWLEFVSRNGDQKYKVVDFDSASRNGEPFEAIINEKKYIPNSLTRFCTTELKIIPKRLFMRDHRYPCWTNAIGIRADEAKRLKNFKVVDGDEFNIFPLLDAGITKPMILDWWSKQPFDLEIGDNEGNCDLCFLKGQRRCVSVLERKPDAANWWINQEQRIGHLFQKGRKSYSQLLQIANEKRGECVPDDNLGECKCDVQ